MCINGGLTLATPLSVIADLALAGSGCRVTWRRMVAVAQLLTVGAVVVGVTFWWNVPFMYILREIFIQYLFTPHLFSIITQNGQENKLKMVSSFFIGWRVVKCLDVYLSHPYIHTYIHTYLSHSWSRSSRRGSRSRPWCGRTSRRENTGTAARTLYHKIHHDSLKTHVYKVILPRGYAGIIIRWDYYYYWTVSSLLFWCFL